MRRIFLPILWLSLLTGCCCIAEKIAREIEVGIGRQIQVETTVWVYETAIKIATWNVDAVPLDPINGPFLLMWKLLRLTVRTWLW
jgi:hypothetical protein